MNELKVVSILIGGNHDSYDFLKSVRGLLELARVKVFDRIRSPSETGNYTFGWDEKGEKICFVAVPYPSPQFLTNVSGDDRKRSMEYSDILSLYLENIAKISTEKYRGYIPILVSHLMISGAKPANTEKEISLLDKFSLPKTKIPLEFRYVALGHIHKFQQIDAPNYIFYPGTLYQIDFGEAEKVTYSKQIELKEGEEKKYCVLVEIDGYKLSTRQIEVEIKRKLRVLEFDTKIFDINKIKMEIEKDKSSLKKVVLRFSSVSDITNAEEYISKISSMESVVSVHLDKSEAIVGGAGKEIRSIIEKYKGEEINIVKLYEEYFLRKGEDMEKFEKVKEKLIEFLSTQTRSE